MLVALDQIVDASLAQEVRLRLLGRAGLPIARALVHPVHTVHAFPTARGLEFSLQLLLLALLFDLVDALLGALALGQRLLLLIVDGGLVAPERWVERLLEVEIAATHDCGLQRLCGG